MAAIANGKARYWGVRIFLALICISTLPYGLQCLFDPAVVKDMAGVVADTTSGRIELRAMYGGFQTAASLLAGLAVFRPALQTATLLFLFVWLGGTVLGRLYGVAIDGEVSGYIRLALGYELVGTALAARFLFRKPAA